MKGLSSKPSIVLIDDELELLNKLKAEVSKILSGDDVDIRPWQPTSKDNNPLETFEKFIDEETIIVATDYDLTGKGMKGLFGHAIVGWCQQRSIPVGDFSRAKETALPEEPSLFELRVPPNDEVKAARFIASAFRGFRKIRCDIDAQPELLDSQSSLAAVLACILGRPQMDSQFALYMSRLGTGNSALVESIRKLTHGSSDDRRAHKIKVLSYVLGHVLLNAILRFPGPVLSDRALCAYLATSDKAFADLKPLFAEALYEGPFGDDGSYFWRENVDMILEHLGSERESEDFDSFGDYNRAVVENSLRRSLEKHECERADCEGRNGGFLCPFTERTVCQRADCSVSASSWIPQGADLCRVEKDFFDEWAPILGL